MTHDDVLNKLTDETIRILIDNNIVKSDEAAINIYSFIKSQLNKALDIGTNHIAPAKYYRNIKVNQLNEFGKVIDTFPSIQAAARTLKIDSSAISKALNGKRITAGGYKWQYS